MQHFKCFFVVLVIVLISLCSLVSCENVSDYIDGSEVTIVDPSFDTATGEEKELIEAKIEITQYKIKMVPAWKPADYGVPIYGRTDEIIGNDKGYITIDAAKINNIGYFTQGIWTFGLKAYNGDTLIYTIPEKNVEINGDNRSIVIEPKEIQYSSYVSKCSVYLNEFDLLLVDSFDKYSIGDDYLIKYSITPVSTSGTVIGETTMALSELSDKVTVTNDILRISGLKVSGENGLSADSYVLSIFFYQKKDGTLVKDGGISYGFTAVPGATLSIVLKDNIDLYPNRFKEVGTSGSGIIIDSGTNSTVEVKGYKFVNGVKTELSTTVTVKTSDTVRFEPVVTNGPASITSYKWFIDGEEQKGTAIDTNGCLTYQPTTAKTYTITYMFLDGTSYNTISGNYYLTVTAS